MQERVSTQEEREKALELFGWYDVAVDYDAPARIHKGEVWVQAWVCIGDEIDASKPYVVVLEAGTDDQHTVSSHETFRQAFDAYRLIRNKTGADIMKRTPDGGLTTEF